MNKKWLFDWQGGGFNSVTADTLKEAIVSAKKFGAVNTKGIRTVTLVPVESSFRPWSIEAEDVMLKAYPFD